MARKRGAHVDARKLAVVAVVAVVAFVLYKRHAAGSQGSADQSVPFSASPYFYADPFGGAGAATSYGGGTASQPVSGSGGVPNPSKQPKKNRNPAPHGGFHRGGGQNTGG